MKRLLPLIPIVLLIFLGNSCTGTFASMAVQSTAAGTPTPIFTVIPAVNEMIKTLNSDLATASPLAWVMDAQYYVIDVFFQGIPNQPGLIAQMNVNCICMNDTQCCTPDRTFVAIVESMRRNNINNRIQWYPFNGVTEFKVVCVNHQKHTEIGSVSIAWQDVQGYLSDAALANPIAGHAKHFQPTP